MLLLIKMMLLGIHSVENETRRSRNRMGKQETRINKLSIRKAVKLLPRPLYITTSTDLLLLLRPTSFPYYCRSKTKCINAESNTKFEYYSKLQYLCSKNATCAYSLQYKLNKKKLRTKTPKLPHLLRCSNAEHKLGLM